jgi:hypothetical protein
METEGGVRRLPSHSPSVGTTCAEGFCGVMSKKNVFAIFQRIIRTPWKKHSRRQAKISLARLFVGYTWIAFLSRSPAEPGEATYSAKYAPTDCKSGSEVFNNESRMMKVRRIEKRYFLEML